MACITNVLHAAQLPPPTLVKAESTETTSFGTLLCDRALIYWTNPPQNQATRYRIFINGRDANDFVPSALLNSGVSGFTLYDDTTQTVQLAAEDSNGEVGPLSNPLTVTTPACVSPKKYKIAVLMATFADFQGTPMPNNLPWTLDVVKNRYGVFQTAQNQSFAVAEWLKRAAYNKVDVTVDYFDEVVLNRTMNQYCTRTLPNYGTTLGYDCNTLQINEDAINANGGRDKFATYQVIAVLAKGLGTVGIYGITISAHGAHYSSYNPDSLCSINS